MKRFAFLPIALLAALTACQSTGGDTASKDAMEMSDSMESSMEMMTERYTVRIEVLEDSSTPIAPVVWAVHTGPNPFVAGDMNMRLDGLEALAEDGSPDLLNETVGMLSNVSAHGVAAVPEGGMRAGPATPGHAYTFEVEAAEGTYLSFATMYVQSNDLFFSPGMKGLALTGEMASSGNVTDEIVLYDAGTEVNEEPGMGPNQAPRQSRANTGPDEMGMVQPVSMVDDNFMYPAVSQVIRVTVDHQM